MHANCNPLCTCCCCGGCCWFCWTLDELVIVCIVIGAVTWWLGLLAIGCCWCWPGEFGLGGSIGNMCFTELGWLDVVAITLCSGPLLTVYRPELSVMKKKMFLNIINYLWKYKFCTQLALWENTLFDFGSIGPWRCLRLFFYFSTFETILNIVTLKLIFCLSKTASSIRKQNIFSKKLPLWFSTRVTE